VIIKFQSADEARAELRRVQAEKMRRAYERAKGSLWEFLKQAWPLIEPSFPLIETWHLRDMCEVLEAVHRKEISRIVFNIPPGHGKSNVHSVAFPAWKWAIDPTWRVLCASYEANLSKRDNLRTIDVIKSEWYRDGFVPVDERTRAAAWYLRKETEDWIINTLGGFRLATSVGGKGTGWRADTIIIDDPLNSLDARSEAARQAAIFWLDKAISSRLKDPRTGQIILIMQRLHADDPTGHVLKQGGYEHFMLPSEYEPRRRSVVYIRKRADDGVDFERDDDGKPLKFELWKDPRGEPDKPDRDGFKIDPVYLFPELYTPEVLEGARVTMGSDGYAGQHQQRPTPAEGGMFKKIHWRFWKPDGVAAEGVPRPEGCYTGPAIPLPKLEQQIISLDCAFKDKKQSDFVVFLVLGTYKAQRFVLDVVRARMSFTKTLAAFIMLAERWPYAVRKLVEDKANGSAVIDTLTADVPGIIAIEPEGGKESRAAAIQPLVEAGNVFLPDGAAWLDDFVQELADFPNGSNDDQVDALSQVLIYLAASPAMARAIALSRM
jgi:predicted phage terminase large subunit-like protein